MSKRLLSLLLIVSFAPTLHAENITSEGMNLEVENVVASQNDVIWGFVFPAPDQILFTLRSGELKSFDLKSKKVTDISGVPKVVIGKQAGLMDISLHPQFDKNRLVYLTYTCGKEKESISCLGRGKLNGDKLENFQLLLELQPRIDGLKNIGSRLTWDKADLLYMTMGDHFDEMKQAQSLNSHLGKVLRLTDEGKPAPGNPFLDKKGALPEIYSFGHRNSEGLFFDRVTNIMWEQEHGAKGGDEINILQAGKNYGWPVISYGVHYDGKKIGEGTHKSGMEQPIHYWDPSIAPSGLIVYHGTQLGKWDGNIFSGALKLTHLNRLVIKNGKVVKEERLMAQSGRRVRDVRQGPDGWIYFSTDSGDIFRIVKATSGKK